MSLFAWLLLGLLAGLIASHLVNHRGEGMILDILLGIVGAIVGGWVFHLLGFTGISRLNLYSLLVAVCGSVGGDPARRSRLSRSATATLCQSPRDWTWAGSGPGIGRYKPNLAPFASIQRQTTLASPSALVRSTARPCPQPPVARLPPCSELPTRALYPDASPWR